ncbi:MAG: hypothetical protein I8H91_03380 [Burkholderiales bacterium]|nr:hypothetical protein [Burkholderiales bacterium]
MNNRQQRISWMLIGLQLQALLTEGLQLLAIDRHPRLLDVGIDMAGTVLALALVKGRSLCIAHR